MIGLREGEEGRDDGARGQRRKRRRRRARPFVMRDGEFAASVGSDDARATRDGRREAGEARTLTTRMAPMAVSGVREDPDTTNRETGAGCCDASTRA